MHEPALYAVAAVLAGLALGALLGALARRIVGRLQRRSNIEGLAGPAAAIVFWVFLVVGIAVAVSILAPDAMDSMVTQILGYLPAALVAVLMLIVGRALATLAGTLFGAALAQATGRTRHESVTVLRVGITVIVVLLALGQFGVNTQLLVLTYGAILLTLSVAMALLIGLGGRHIAREIAAGRYLRRIISEGDRIRTATLHGTVVALHAVTTELDLDQPGTTHLNNTALLDGPITVEHPS